AAERSAHQFQDTATYQASVLTGRAARPPSPAPEGPSTVGLVYGVAAAACAVGVAAVALFRRRLPAPSRDRVRRLGQPVLFHLRSLHSGHIGDYLAWLTLGLAAVGGLFTLALRS